MIMRDATFKDLEPLLPLAREAHLQSIFAGVGMNEAMVQRNLVTAISFDGGFAKVIEKEGEVLGGMVGIMVENHFGIRCAVDLFAYSRGGTDLLVKSFMKWAQAQGAKFVQITDLSGNTRYHNLLTGVGLHAGGTTFIGVF